MKMTPEQANEYARKILTTKRKHYVAYDNLYFYNDIRFNPKLRTFHINNQEYKMDKKTHTLACVRHRMAKSNEFWFHEEGRVLIFCFAVMFGMTVIVTLVDNAIVKKKNQNKQEFVQDSIPNQIIRRDTINGICR